MTITYGEFTFRVRPISKSVIAIRSQRDDTTIHDVFVHRSVAHQLADAIVDIAETMSSEQEANS